MSDTIKTLPWKTQKVTVRSEQRLLIETAHGMLEISASLERSHGRQVALEIKLPPDLRFRKGDKGETTLHGKFLTEEGKPTFSLLSPVPNGKGHELKQVKAIRSK